MNQITKERERQERLKKDVFIIRDQRAGVLNLGSRYQALNFIQAKDTKLLVAELQGA